MLQAYAHPCSSWIGERTSRTLISLQLPCSSCKMFIISLRRKPILQIKPRVHILRKKRILSFLISVTSMEVLKASQKTLFHRQEWKSSLLNQQAGLTAIHWLHVEQVLLLCRCRIKQPLRGVSSVCVCHQHGIQKTHGRLIGFCNVSHGFNKGILGLHVGIRCPMVYRCRMILS